MKTDPLVSVIVPVYNVEKFIGRCLNSIINQKYNNIEIIVVNDGSTDNSGKICDDFATIDQRVKVIHKNNGGVSSARNKGLDNISVYSEYVLFVDGDDYISNQLIEENLGLLYSNNADLICYNRAVIENGKIIEKYFYQEKMTMEEVIRGIYIKDLPSGIVDKMYKRRIWDKIRFQEGVIFEDLYVIPFVLKKAKKIICNSKVYYFYERGNLCSISHNIKIRSYYLEFYGACIKAEVAKDIWPNLYKFCILRAYEYAIKSIQYNFYFEFLDKKQIYEINVFLHKYKDFCKYLTIEYKIYVKDYFNFNFINRLKGLFYYIKNRNTKVRKGHINEVK